MVTKQLNNKEIAHHPAAKAAMDKEYNKLKNHTWDETKVREFDEVVMETKTKNETFHVDRVYGSAGINGHELPVGPPLRKYEGRYVFQGSHVKDQDGNCNGPYSESLGLLRP
eukprot:5048029-Amphidinium_carterae.4